MPSSRGWPWPPGWLWLAAVLVVGFALRVASGPRVDPFGRLATKVIAPRLGEPVLVAGAPKRFAQGVGLVLTTVATIALVLSVPRPSRRRSSGCSSSSPLLESVAGFCAGCWVFGYLMRWGLVPEAVCVACNDITLRRQQPTTA